MDAWGRAASNGVHNAAGVYPRGETERLSRCLTRLRPHLRLDEVALAGGVAISLRVAETGLTAWRHSIPDLDFVARRREAIAASGTEEFRTDVYSTDLDVQCARCEASRDPAFPL